MLVNKYGINAQGKKFNQNIQQRAIRPVGVFMKKGPITRITKVSSCGFEKNYKNFLLAISVQFLSLNNFATYMFA